MFKYHMTLSRGEAQTVWVPPYGRDVLAKSSYNFCSGWKSLIQFLLLYLWPLIAKFYR